MAIRLQLPPFARLRLHWFATRSEILRQKRAWQERWESRRDSQVVPTRVARPRLMERLNVRSLWRMRVARIRLAQLLAFEHRYEELVDLICWAAKDSDNAPASHEERYGELRVRMRLHYRAVRPRLRPHWQSVMDTAGVEADPFEGLFTPDSLDKVIYASGGIETMMAARMAIDTYRAELETVLGR